LPAAVRAELVRAIDALAENPRPVWSLTTP